MRLPQTIFDIGHFNFTNLLEVHAISSDFSEKWRSHIKAFVFVFVFVFTFTSLPADLMTQCPDEGMHLLAARMTAERFLRQTVR